MCSREQYRDQFNFGVLESLFSILPRHDKGLTGEILHKKKFIRDWVLYGDSIPKLMTMEEQLAEDVEMMEVKEQKEEEDKKEDQDSISDIPEEAGDELIRTFFAYRYVREDEVEFENLQPLTDEQEDELLTSDDSASHYRRLPYLFGLEHVKYPVIPKPRDEELSSTLFSADIDVKEGRPAMEEDLEEDNIGINDWRQIEVAMAEPWITDEEEEDEDDYPLWKPPSFPPESMASLLSSEREELEQILKLEGKDPAVWLRGSRKRTKPRDDSTDSDDN